ncbi:MAG TPA: SRPBCC family protein [Methyloceanibacter sp.]|nr:SRPBCC family protein [Methyloceanibacter sp.]
MPKKILIALAAIILIFLVIVALQPSDFRVERTAAIAAPATAVFAQVNDFHKWEAWSPWAKLGPAAKVTFEGPDSGQGAVLAWAGNDEVGEGKMTLVESHPNDVIKIKTDFVKPFEGTISSEFAFKQDGEQTAVTWAMAGHHNFIEKAFCLVMNGTKMVGDDLEKGLAQLKSVTESAKNG